MDWISALERISAQLDAAKLKVEQLPVVQDLSVGLLLGSENSAVTLTRWLTDLVGDESGIAAGVAATRSAQCALLSVRVVLEVVKRLSRAAGEGADGVHAARFATYFVRGPGRAVTAEHPGAVASAIAELARISPGVWMEQLLAEHTAQTGHIELLCRLGSAIADVGASDAAALRPVAAQIFDRLLVTFVGSRADRHRITSVLPSLLDATVAAVAQENGAPLCVPQVQQLWDAMQAVRMRDAGSADPYMLLGQLFRTIKPMEDRASASFVWSMIYEGLDHADALVRKCAIDLLKQALGVAASEGGQAGAGGSLQHWARLVSMYEIVEFQVETHIVEPAWHAQFEPLFAAASSIPDADPASMHDGEGLPLLGFTWIAIVLRRALVHVNQAVRKVALLFLLEHPLAQVGEHAVDSHSSLVGTYGIDFVCTAILPALDDEQLYGRNDCVGALAEGFLVQFAAAVEAAALARAGGGTGANPSPSAGAAAMCSFVSIFLATACLKTLSASALLHQLRAFARSVEGGDTLTCFSRAVVDDGVLEAMRQVMVTRVCVTFEVHIRDAVLAAIVGIVVRLCQPDQVSLRLLARTLCSMPLVVWSAASPQRALLQQWAAETGLNLSVELASHLLGEGQRAASEPVLPPADLGKMLVLSSSLPPLLSPLFVTMRRMYGQPYSRPGAAELALEIFTAVLRGASNEQVVSLSEAFDQCADELCAYIEAAVLRQLQLNAPLSCEAADARALDALAACAAAFPGSGSVKAVSSRLLARCIEALLSLEAGPHTVEAQFAKGRAVAVVAAVHATGVASQPVSGAGDAGLVAALLQSTCRASAKQSIGGREWNTLAAGHAQTKWECLAAVLEFPRGGDDAAWLDGDDQGAVASRTVSGYTVDVAVAVACCEEALDVCTEAYVVPIMRSLLAVLIPHLHGVWLRSADQEDRLGPVIGELTRILRSAWSAFSECRKKSGELVTTTLALLFPIDLCSGRASCVALHTSTGVLRSYFDSFRALGEQQRPLLMQFLIVHLCSIWKQHPAGAVPYANELVEMCLYKEPLLKEAFLDGIIIQLLDMSLASSYCGGISAGSAVFGRKLRSWQTLCLLSCHVHEELVPAVNARLWDVVRQANLNAIAHYVELFAARLVARYPLLLVEQHVLRELSDVSIAGHIAASFGLILGVALPRLMAHGLGDLREAAVTAMLPWLSCDTGHARTIAQCVVSQLLPDILRERETAGDAADVDVSDTAFLRATLAMLQQNKDIVRMLGMQQRYFARTDPERECSLEALLSAPLSDSNEIEPLALMACIKDTLKSVHKMLTNEYIEQVGGPRAPAADAARAVEAPALSSAGDIQRKVDPWAALQAALQQQSSDAPEVCGRANLVSCGRTRQPLLVCASLVDKVPNLAGLARTCEIFGAEGLTIPSMKLMAHPLFTQISVTAEKWVPVTEVKETGLRPYLTTCKKAGYTVVGVEQTANSCNLLDYTFPEKVVLVLGKEREGIPVDVLQDVDVCVEIPQLGLIRSLNVHVTGALMIWAYTQQKLLAKQALQDRDTSDLAPPPPPPTDTPL